MEKLLMWFFIQPLGIYQVLRIIREHNNIILPFLPLSRYLIDEKSATSLDGNIQDALFIMAVANSIANPLVYGFNESCKKRREQNHLQDTYKEPDQRSDAVIMNNQNSCRCSHKTRVRFSTRSPQTQQSAV